MTNEEDDDELEGLGGLFQIEEPLAPARSRRNTAGRAIGIDLGTTHSLVAIAPHGEPPRALPDAEGRVLLPSVVSYLEDAPRVGWEAQARRVEDPARVVSSVKRFMGRGEDDIQFSHPYRLVKEGESSIIRLQVGSRRVTPTEVSAEVLRVLKARAEAVHGALF